MPKRSRTSSSLSAAQPSSKRAKLGSETPDEMRKEKNRVAAAKSRAKKQSALNEARGTIRLLQETSNIQSRTISQQASTISALVKAQPEAVQDLVEKNTRLLEENQRLRERLACLPGSPDSDAKSPSPKPVSLPLGLPGDFHKTILSSLPPEIVPKQEQSSGLKKETERPDSARSCSVRLPKLPDAVCLPSPSEWNEARSFGLQLGLVDLPPSAEFMPNVKELFSTQSTTTLCRSLSGAGALEDFLVDA